MTLITPKARQSFQSKPVRIGVLCTGLVLTALGAMSPVKNPPARAPTPPMTEEPITVMEPKPMSARNQSLLYQILNPEPVQAQAQAKASVETPSLPNAQVKIKGDWIACSSRAVHDRMIKLSARGDNEGGMNLFLRSDCKMLQEGDLMHIDEYEMFGSSCLSYVGKGGRCYWTPSEATKK